MVSEQWVVSCLDRLKCSFWGTSELIVEADNRFLIRKDHERIWHVITVFYWLLVDDVDLVILWVRLLHQGGAFCSNGARGL